jgi:glycosyltransferase involved in cell wall biosynthesis
MKPEASRQSTRPRLLFLITSRYAGGAEQSLLRLMERLSVRYECLLAGPATIENRAMREAAGRMGAVVEFDAAEPKDDPGVRLRPGRFLAGCWRTLRLFWRVRPDLVVFFLHLPLVAAAPRFVAALLRKRSIVSFRLVVNGVPAGPRRVRLLKWEKARNQVWVAVSQDNRRGLCQDMGLAEKDVRLIYNGIGPLEGGGRVQGAARRELRRKLGIPEHRVVFLFAGRLTPLKGCRELAAASVQVWKRCPEALCVLVGDGPDRPYLESWIRERSAGDALRLEGARPNVMDYMAAADVFVHPSHAEGLSNSLLEAMQMGLPVIAANCSSMPELVRDPVEGFLVPKKDPEALGQAMMALLGDQALRERMGQAASFRAEHFPVEAMYSGWDQLIQEALEDRSGS